MRTSNSVLDLRDAVGEGAIQKILPATMDVNLFAPAVFPFMFEMLGKAYLQFNEHHNRYLVAQRHERHYMHVMRTVFGCNP